MLILIVRLSVFTSFLVGGLFLNADEPTSTPTPATDSSQESDSEESESPEQVQTALDLFKIDTSPGTHTEVLNDNFLFYGNLFNARENYAIISVGNALGFAKFVDGKWKLKGQWKIACVWRPEGWKRGDGDYPPIRPVSIPFELQDFDGDGIPEVIIAGEMGKFYQRYYLFRFDSRTENLIELDNAMAEPELSGGYVRLYENSGHFSTFEEWRFMKFDGNRLKEIAMWHYGSPRHEGDDEGPRAAWRDKKDELKYCQWNTGLDDVPEGIYTLEASMGKPIGSVKFTPKRPLSLSEQSLSCSLENIWLFHHFTGLPVELYPHDEDNNVIPDKHSLNTLLQFENVEVTGDPDLVDHLKSVKDNP